MVRIFVHLAHWHLMSAPVPLGSLAVDLFGAGPAFRRAHDDHRPDWATFETVAPRFLLNASDIADHCLERRGHELMHLLWIIALDEVRRIAVAAKQMVELFVRD